MKCLVTPECLVQFWVWWFCLHLEKYGIYPDKTSTSSPIEEIIIDAAKQLPYYFCRFFKVSVSKYFSVETTTPIIIIVPSSDRNGPLSFHCFENSTVLHVIQSWSSDQNVSLSFHCFENHTVLHVIQSWASDQNVPLSFHCFGNPTVLHVIQWGSCEQNVPLSFYCFEKLWWRLTIL